MTNRILVMALCVVCSTAHPDESYVPNLPHALNAGSALLQQPAPDPNECRRIATELLAGVDAYPASSLAGDALYLVVQLVQMLGDDEASIAAARRILLDYATCEHAPEAFHVVWNLQTEQGRNPFAGAQTARDFAERLGSSPKAERYYQIAFDAYSASNQWKEAAELGKRYLTLTAEHSTNPDLYLTISEVAVRAGETQLARESLEHYCSRYVNLPRLVIARNQLGYVHSEIGNMSLAKQNRTMAWSLYQKNLNQSGYDDPKVRHAAADALWMLQESDKKALEGSSEKGAEMSESEARKTAKRLTEAYERVLETDPDFAVLCHTAMGEVIESLARVLVSKNSTKVAADASVNVYSEAIELCVQAQSHFQIAFERSLGSEEMRANRSATQYTAKKVFELACYRSKLQFDWMNMLLSRVPVDMPGLTDDQRRIEFLADAVMPAGLVGLGYASSALALPSVMPLDNEKSLLVNEIGQPLLPVAQELSRLCNSQWQKTSSMVIQVASSIRFGIRTTSSSNLVQGLDTEFALSASLADVALPALNRLVTTIQKSDIPMEASEKWQDLLVQCYSDFSLMCATVTREMNDCVSRVQATPASPLASLKSSLNRISAEANREEYRWLTQWHVFSEVSGSERPLDQRMRNRLAELDPKTYGALEADPSASRKP